jgi:uncharacterized membrane protein
MAQKTSTKTPSKATTPSVKQPLASLERKLPWILTIAGVFGIISSFIISVDKFKLLENPKFLPNCDLNPIISCGSVMSSKQGAAFGFPNPFIGLAAFAIVITIGVGLLAGARYKKWYWQGLNLGAALGVAFITWLFFQSVYRINALCPYCMVVWVCTITTFWYVTQYNLQTRALVIPGKVGPRITAFVQKHHLDILILWFIVIAALILKHFWYYYGRNL